MTEDLEVVVVTQNDPFYVPVLLEKFFEELDDRVTVSRVVCLSPFNESLPELLSRTYRLFGPRGFLLHSFSYLVRRTLDSVNAGRHSVRKISESRGVPVDYVESVNSEGFIRQVESDEIDIILSASVPEIFNEELLSAPAWGCLNIHTADLPKYRGMMPTFWALYHGETELGVTVHEMVEDIDAGRIAAQATFDVTDLESLHQVILRGKRIGGRLAAKTLSEIVSGNVTLEEMTGKGSYFSFPTAADRKELQSRGWRTR